jgi:SAM-dependent methyltransferase
VAYKAVHLPGGNYFDDVRLDLPASYATQDEWLRSTQKVSVRTSKPRAALRRVAYKREPYRVREALVSLGLRRTWFEEFRGYWEDVLDGRPLTVMDFHNLRFNYRKRSAGNIRTLSWSSGQEHLANWQDPVNLFQTFEFVYRTALHPVWGGTALFDVLEDDFRVLEYGCGMAPMYRTWRTFLSSTPTRWVLAEIPGYSFHYARHVFGRDAEADFVVIDDFADPLAGVTGAFDLIIVQTVFEHLDHPRHIAQYLLDRLKPGGLFLFDYVRTDGTGLDTPTALAERRSTLEHLGERLEFANGDFRIDDRSLHQCVGRKPA